MSQLVKISGERRLLYSPKAFQLIDDFTGKEPIGRIAVSLQEAEGANRWRDVDFAPMRSPSDVFSFPGLGQTVGLAGEVRAHRALIDSDCYMSKEVEFETHLYNDVFPLEPSEYARQLDIVRLVPNSRYPYLSHIPVLRGKVTHGANGPPFPSVELRYQSLTAFSNSDGEFTLPVRSPADDTHLTARSELNSVQVHNARGYAKAVLSFPGVEGQFRVFEIAWKDLATPTNYEATLTLDPLPGGGDLEPGLPLQTKVSLVTFALLLDFPPYGATEIDQVADISPTSGFQNFQTIAIPTSP